MNDLLYSNLSERLNKIGGKIIPTKSFLELLADMYTEEEASIAVDFPQGAFTVAELTKIYKKDEAELAKLLEIMTSKGTVFKFTENGNLKWELAPFLPGAIEWYMHRIADNKEKMRKAVEAQATAAVEAIVLISELMEKDPEKAMALVAPVPPVTRAVTIDQVVSADAKTMSYASIMDILDKETLFAVTRCVCRDHCSEILDHRSCLVPGVPDYSCITVGKSAEHTLEYNHDAKQITRDECKKLIETCSKLGLVINAAGFTQSLHFICNCCTCCCGILKTHKALGPNTSISKADFEPLVDADSCTGCGTCVERCPVNAITIKDDLASINQDICLGCGQCATVCPLDSISMKRANKAA
jgi:Pyruvate/2-oxoacid:ferredoxin oxidoreductase delta subunit